MSVSEFLGINIIHITELGYVLVCIMGHTEGVASANIRLDSNVFWTFGQL